MYTLYVIRSLHKNWNYVGFTSNLDRRLKQHNNKKVRSTKAYAPFKLIYSKKISTREKARDLEKYYKIRCNKEKLLAEVAELADA